MSLTRRRRRKDESGAFVGLLAVVVGVLALIALVESPLGIPLALALVAGAAFYGRLASHRQAVYARQWRTVENLRSLSGLEFERHVAELYRKLGYRTEITRGSGDQGVDVIAQNSQHRIGIQCKQWQANVGNDAVQEALAGRVFYNCSHAAVICTSTFTPLARQLAERGGVQLIDGAAYAGMVNQFDTEPVKKFAAEWFPRGRALVVQIGMLTVALIVFIVHAGHPIHFTAAGESMAAGSTSSAYSTPPSSSSVASTVERFYDDINAKRYDDAYSLLSPSWQAQQSYNNFVQGYADTLSVTARVTPTSSRTVEVQVEAQEYRQGGTVVSHYVGRYRGSIDSDGNWRLDSGGLRPV